MKNTWWQRTRTIRGETWLLLVRFQYLFCFFYLLTCSFSFIDFITMTKMMPWHHQLGTPTDDNIHHQWRQRWHAMTSPTATAMASTTTTMATTTMATTPTRGDDDIWGNDDKGRPRWCSWHRLWPSGVFFFSLFTYLLSLTNYFMTILGSFQHNKGRRQQGVMTTTRGGDDDEGWWRRWGVMMMMRGDDDNDEGDPTQHCHNVCFSSYLFFIFSTNKFFPSL